MKTICFDLDGVICTNTWGDYNNAIPNQKAIEKINYLYKKNYKIIIHTARFMGRNSEDPIKANAEGYDLTCIQLNKWKVKYHKLIMGKPSYDVVVDDKSIFYSENWIYNLE
tara:strand:+ start:29 stop:361 length:333 start_codon:yes stop_codon:yes gene_type:complete